MVPEKLSKAEREIDEFQEKYDQIMQLKPLKEQVCTQQSEINIFNVLILYMLLSISVTKHYILLFQTGVEHFLRIVTIMNKLK